MVKSIHNWIAVVAILAVALLGVIAIDRNSDNRISTQREALVSTCLRSNEARQAANIEIQRLEVTVDVLRSAVKTAQGEHGQTANDRVAYARLQATLGQHITPKSLKIINCEKAIPNP